MPVTLVGISSQAAATTPLAPPSGVQVGDLLVAHTGADTTTTPSGWTRMETTGSDWKSGYWRFAGSGDNSITSPQTYTGMQMVAFRGVPSLVAPEYDESKTLGTLTVPALTSTGTAGSLLVELYSTTYSGGNPNGHFALPNEIQLSPGFYAGYQLLANGETKPSFNISATSAGATYGTAVVG